MMHEIEVSGPGFRLRPVELADAPLIVALRGDPERSRYLHAVPPDLDVQRAWLERYFEREGEYYFVIDRVAGGCSHPEGLISVYDVDADRGAAEWGRWIVARRSLAATESAWLIYRIGFDVLGLEEMYCHTLAENRSTLSFHDRCGLVRRRELEIPSDVPGETWRAVEHVLTRAAWARVSVSLSDRAERFATRLGIELIERRERSLGSRDD